MDVTLVSMACDVPEIDLSIIIKLMIMILLHDTYGNTRHLHYDINSIKYNHSAIVHIITFVCTITNNVLYGGIVIHIHLDFRKMFIILV